MRAAQNIYFIRPVGMAGPVKIGCSSLPENRLASLVVWSPFPLEIVASLPGDFLLERRFHAAFMGSWSHSEWFHPSRAMDEMIAAINDGAFDVDTLPAPKAVPTNRRVIGWTEFQKMGASLNARVAALRKRGVSVPEDVRHRAFRYTAGRYLEDYDPHREDDAHFVQGFLAQHGYEPRPVPANDAAPKSEAA